MRRKKSIIGIVLTILMIINIFPAIKTSAASFTPRYSLSYADTQSKYWASGTYGVSNGFPRNWNSGYSGGNCTWYAFGRAWELLGTLPNLCTNNAGAWYSYNKNNGYYPYGSTPKLGAIACWDHYDNDTGHVAVVEEIGSDYIVCSESGWSYTNGYFSTKTRSLNDSTLGMGSSYRFLGYIYIGNFSPDTTPPTITNLTVTNKSTSSFTVNCTADETLSRAYMIVYGPGGNSGNGFDIYNVNSTSFSRTINTGDYGGAGDYTVHVYVFDSSGNEAAASTGGFSVPSLKVNSYTVSNITNTSFVLNGNTNYSISRAYIIVYGPGGNSGQGFDIYDINSTSFSKKINISDYGGQGRYVAHLYVFDNAGNSAPAATEKFYVPQSLANPSTSTTATRTSSEIEVQTTISNLSQSAQCAIAVYSSDGKLLGNSVTNADSSTQSVTAYFPSYTDASYVKVFLWDSLKGMKPLTNGEKVNL